ncbi:MAG TPA: hypothetical protein VND96_02625 [Candidatus Micrarchaeaceae archaeon]|nr:hypothetical protein [Candidatus Micrarchaeaceae archaeon]
MLLFALAALVVVVFRQMGYLLRLKGVGTARDGLAAGSRAPGFQFRASTGGYRLERFEPGGNWTLLVFADPGCVSCESAIDKLEGLRTDAPTDLQVVIATSLEPSRIAPESRFLTTSIPILHVASDVATKLYQSNSVPLAILVDRAGIVRGKTIPTDANELATLLRISTEEPNAVTKVLEA